MCGESDARSQSNAYGRNQNAKKELRQSAAVQIDLVCGSASKVSH